MSQQKYTAINVLQKAIFDRLAADGQTSAFKVYDDPPEGAKMPYVIIGETYGADMDTKTYSGEDLISTVNVWSRERGNKEVNLMIAKIVEAITSSDLDLSADEFKVIQTTVDYRELISGEENDEAKKGVIRFRFLIEAHKT